MKAPDLFATDAPPASARPREAVVLTHMAEEEKAEAAAWLRERGYRIVSSTRVANLALVGEGVAKNELRQISAVTGKAMTLRELKASRPSEATAVTVVAPPVREPDPEPLFLEDEDSVTLAGLVLPKNKHASPLVSPAAQFAHLVIDQPLAETMRAIAVGVVHGSISFLPVEQPNRPPIL